MSEKQLTPSEALRIFAVMQPEHGSYAGELRRIADEFDTLEAELEQARKALAEESVLKWSARKGRQEAGTCPHSNCDAQRYRDALARIAAYKLNNALTKIARDALAGEGQT